LNRRGRLIFGLLITSAACALVAGAAIAQALNKPYQKWTAKEAERLLTDSPWAQTDPGLVMSGRFDPITEVVDTTITVRLRSALPVRQALARLNQLKDGYDQKNESDRTVIDARNKELLECSECADYYAVSITPGAGSRSDLPAFLSSGRTAFELVRQNVFLENDTHETRELKKFTRPKSPAGEAIFFFPRLDSKGNSLVGPGSRTVIISFDPRVFDWKKSTVTKFKFDVARMTIGGQVAF
jgi:hypothetical protein